MDSDILDDLSGPAGPASVVATGRNGVDPAIDGLSDPLRHALMTLNEGFRFAVVLCDLLGFPYSEAAEILGVQEGTIKSRIFRAREALATALTQTGYEIPRTATRDASGPDARNRDTSEDVTRQNKLGENV
jgi:DNA-directed RNA polymerase specialized sigma24 family protein